MGVIRDIRANAHASVHTEQPAARPDRALSFEPAAATQPAVVRESDFTPTSDGEPFSTREAAHHFVHGMREEFLEIVNVAREHPITTVAVATGSFAASMAFPPVGVALLAASAVASAGEIGRGTYGAAKALQAHRTGDAERAFEEIGHGVSGAAMVGMGLGVDEGLAALGLVEDAAPGITVGTLFRGFLSADDLLPLVGTAEHALEKLHPKQQAPDNS